MAGSAFARELTSARHAGARFAVATQADDAEIRRLLRENPTPGQISLSLEREPDYFADAHWPDETKQTIVARKNGRLVCVGSCVLGPRFVNGQPRRVGYLGGLRLDAPHAGRFDIVRRGYEFFRELQAEAAADFYFTVIAADNERARKFLERGLPRMPEYEFIGDFVTVLLPTAGQNRIPLVGDRVAHPADAEFDEFIAHLNEQNRLNQFTPVWSADRLAALETLGLRKRDFHFVQKQNKVAGAALWDQRSFKQTVVRGYAPWLKVLRPGLNFAARIIRGAQLPDVGTMLGNAFVSHLVAHPDAPESLVALLVDLCGLAARRKMESLTLGFAASDPRLATVRDHFRGREYHTRVYRVRWPEVGGAAGELDGRFPAPEVALL